MSVIGNILAITLMIALIKAIAIFVVDMICTYPGWCEAWCDPDACKHCKLNVICVQGWYECYKGICDKSKNYQIQTTSNNYF